MYKNVYTNKHICLKIIKVKIIVKIITSKIIWVKIYLQKLSLYPVHKTFKSIDGFVKVCKVSNI